MASNRRIRINRKMPEWAAMLPSLRRAAQITARLNTLMFNDADQVRALFGELIGKTVDDAFLPIPPFHTTGGQHIRVGRNLFINRNCTLVGGNPARVLREIDVA